MKIKEYIPNMFTFLNLALGFLAIVMSINRDFIFASILLLLAVLADGLDGRTAKALKVESKLGIEMDSLADLVSFGVAPAVLMHSFHKDWFLMFAALIFVLGGAYRLARFNITKEKKKGFVGMPITINGIIFPMLYLLNTNTLVVAIVFLISFFLMISTFSFRLKKVTG